MTAEPPETSVLQPKTLLFSTPTENNGDDIFSFSYYWYFCVFSTKSGKPVPLVIKKFRYLNFQPLRNSTPLLARPKTNIAPPSTVQKSCSITRVTITIGYPSKTVRKQLTEELASLGKAIAFGDEKRVARVVMKNTNLNKSVVNLVLKKLGEELNKRTN